MANLCGKIGLGLLSSLPTVDTFYLFNVMVLLRGLPLFLVLAPYSYNLNLHIAIMVIYGFATSHMVLTPEILIQLYGPDNLNKLVSLFNVFSKGPGILIGTTSGGFILESYDHKTVCIISGVVFIVSCVTCFAAKLWWEKLEKKKKKVNLFCCVV